MTPEQRAMRARLGGLATSARGHNNTKPGRDAFMESEHVGCKVCGPLDPIPEETGPEERARMMAARRKLHMSKLAYKSARKRKRG